MRRSQTVYWNVGYCAFAPAQPVQCFVNIPSSVPPGNYTALIFATTNSSIPISTSTSLRVSL